MGQRSTRKARILAQRLGWDRKVDNRPDILRNCFAEWDPRCQLLLLSGLSRPKGTQEHPSHACVTTRLPVPQLSETDHPGDKGGPVRGPQFAHISTKTLDRRPSLFDRYFVYHRRRRPGRMCRRSAILGSPLRPRSSRQRLAVGQILHHGKAGTAHPVRISPSPVGTAHPGLLTTRVELSRVDEDIRLYLQEKLGAVAKRRSDLELPDQWPSDDELTALTKKSSGLFIFASTLVKFIESEDHEPRERLRLIVALPDNTAHEGRAGTDLLYTQVFTYAFSGIKQATVFASLRRVLGTVVLAFNPLSRVQISGILGLEESLIATTSGVFTRSF